MTNPLAIYTLPELRKMFRFYRRGPRKSKSLREVCRSIINELRERKYDEVHCVL
jgi:hypothetical protein